MLLIQDLKSLWAEPRWRTKGQDTTENDVKCHSTSANFTVALVTFWLSPFLLQRFRSNKYHRHFNSRSVVFSLKGMKTNLSQCKAGMGIVTCNLHGANGVTPVGKSLLVQRILGSIIRVSCVCLHTFYSWFSWLESSFWLK